MAKQLSLRSKLMLMILPLVLVVVVISGFLSSLESRASLTRLANRHLAYKAEQLRNYVLSEWEAVRELNLEKQPEYREAMEESFFSYALSLLRSRTESVLVFDTQGRLVMKIDAGSYYGEDSGENLVTDLAPGWFSRDLGGGSRVGVAFELESFGWLVAVTELGEVFFSDIQNIRFLSFAVLLAAALVLTLLITLFIGHVAGPVERLTGTVVHIEQTMDLSQRAEVEYADEIGLLAHKFNNLINTLQKSYQQLRLSGKAEEEARKTAVEREKETLFILGRVSDFRDEDTGGHLRRIGSLSELFCRLLGHTPQEQELIRQCSPLHDIGKIGIPDAILLKPGKLTAEEFDQIKQHTVLGYQILKDSTSPYLMEGAVIALTHHEKWDGSGYPRGLAGENIPINGRIVSIVDVFDALTSERPYKEAWSREKALALICEQRGKQFDPRLVEVFETNFSEFAALL